MNLSLKPLKRLSQWGMSRLPLRVLGFLPASLREFVLPKYERSLAVYPRSFEIRRHGAVMRGTTSDFIQRHVFVYGVWEPCITEVFVNSLGPGDNVLDVGANWGYYTLLAAELTGPSGRVVAVEALPSAAKALQECLSSNTVANVELVAAMAGSRVGQQEMFRAGDENLGSSASTLSRGFVSEGMVDRVRLDDLLTDEFIKDLRLIKIDTEGDEAEVLSGLQGTLAKLGPGARVLVELSPQLLKRRGATVDDVLANFPNGEWRMNRVPNEYVATHYLRSGPCQPQRFLEDTNQQQDLIFQKT